MKILPRKCKSKKDVASRFVYECGKHLKQFHKAKIESDRHLAVDRVKDKIAKKLLELAPEQYLLCQPFFEQVGMLVFDGV